ncbi:hypothetical protein B7L09_13845 [Pseudomonas mandelii]|nr:hypothetical protein B7L09_13845 [Pseudomonas mandelii]
MRMSWSVRRLENTGGPCGSELARDEAISVNIDVGCQCAIASKLAPTGIVFQLTEFTSGCRPSCLQRSSSSTPVPHCSPSPPPGFSRCRPDP